VEEVEEAEEVDEVEVEEEVLGNVLPMHGEI